MPLIKKVLLWENPKDHRFYLWNVAALGWINTDHSTTRDLAHPNIDSAGDRVTAFTRAARLGFKEIEVVKENPQGA